MYNNKSIYKEYGIYGIKNKLNNKIYVGKTIKMVHYIPLNKLKKFVDCTKQKTKDIQKSQN